MKRVLNDYGISNKKPRTLCKGLDFWRIIKEWCACPAANFSRTSAALFHMTPKTKFQIKLVATEHFPPM